jgi:hypothetical protein
LHHHTLIAWFLLQAIEFISEVDALHSELEKLERSARVSLHYFSSIKCFSFREQ